MSDKMGFRKFIKISSGLVTGVLFFILTAGSRVMAQSADAAAAPDYTQAYKSAAYNFLLFFLLCVFIAIIGRIFKLYELNRTLQGKKAGINWNKVNGVIFLITLISALFGTYWTFTHYGAMSYSESASIHGEQIDSMFNVTLIITTIVFILTHIALFGFSFKYPGSNKRKAYFYPHNNALERWWTIVPAITLTILVLLGFFTWRSITIVPEAQQKSALNVEVTGEQFTWTIRYAGGDNQVGRRNYKLTSATNGLGVDFKDRTSWDDKMAGELVLPVDRPVRVIINAKDVLHSFYMPAFRVQMNAVPGMVTSFQFTPRFTTKEMREKRNDPTYDYVLLCAKICGQGHYNMQKKVRVVSETEYQQWLAQQPLFYNDDVKKELQMAEQNNADAANKLALNKNNR
jgi:cytochrome c oxidase subunit II